MNISEQERCELSIKIIGFLQVGQEAIDILNKHIEAIEHTNNEELKKMLPSLRHGLWVLEGGKARVIRDGIEGTWRDLQRSERGGRPGLGLNRGFGEFLYNFKNRGFKDEWADEIMDAVDKIEDYYNEM